MGDENEQFLKAYDWDGKELKREFAIDFYSQARPAAHHALRGPEPVRELTLTATQRAGSRSRPVLPWRTRP